MVKRGQGQSEVCRDVTRLGIYDTPALPNSDSGTRKTLSPFPFQKLITLLSDLVLLAAQTLWKLD